MTQKTPLTDEQILDLWSPRLDSEVQRPILGKNKIIAFARAIEAASAQPLVGERSAIDVVRQAIEERDAMEHDLELLANETVYKGNSVSWWHSKAMAYRDAIDRCWAVLKAHGHGADGSTRIDEKISAILASKQPAAASEREGWKAIRVACSRGHAWIARGVRWQDQLTLTEWEVVEPTGTAIYSPSGLGGTLCFWCKPINGTVPGGWAKDARPDGCVSFCGDSIAAAVLVAAAPSVGDLKP